MKRLVLVLIPLIIIGGLIGWRVTQERAEAASQVTMREMRGKAPVAVEVMPVTRQNIDTSVAAVGTLEATEAVDLTPKIVGRVIYLQVRAGDRVVQGQVLVRIEASDMEATLRQKQAVVAQAKARLAEAEIGQNPNDVALQTAIHQQEAALATAVAQERQAKADYDTRIAAAQAAITDAEGRVTQADANIAAAAAAIKTAKANLENARVKLERQQSLLKEGAVARQIVDDAATTVSVQEGTVGEAEQRREAAVAAKASAIAQKEAAEKQATVTRNQAQATIDVTREGVRQARATLTAARANSARGSAYDKNLAALKADVIAAEADAATTQAQLNATQLRSPLNGVVARRYLDPGAVASPTQPVIAVQETQEVWVNFGVPQEISRRLYRGQVATVTLDSFPGKTFTGKIVRIEPAADPTSGQFAIRVALANPNGQFKPGTFANVRMISERIPNALVVPREAVLIPRKEGSEPTVTLAIDGKAVVKPVQVGPTDGKVYVIQSGVQEGDEVVILTGRPLKDGQTITTGPPGSSKSSAKKPEGGQEGAK